MNQDSTHKTTFLLKNLINGLFWLGAVIAGYTLIQKYFDFDLTVFLGPLYDNTFLIYFIFLISELVFGIIPPEFFMFWAASKNLWLLYLQHVTALMFISYFAGIIGYLIGAKFGDTKFYRLLRRNRLRKFEKYFRQFGGFLLIVAALTPIPFSGICMLTGSVKYSFQKFIWISMSRFVRFFLYAVIVWEANSLN